MFTYNVDRIPSAGIAIDGELARDTVTFLLGDHYRPTSTPATIRFELQRRGDNLLVDGETRLEFEFECGRCAETFTREETVPFSLVCIQGAEDAAHAPASDDVDVDGLGEESSFSAAPTEREVHFYQGSALDLEPAISEQVVLALPDWPVCTDDCKGLCPNCGTNLNNEACTCATKGVDPRWAALGTLKAAIGGTLPRS